MKSLIPYQKLATAQIRLLGFVAVFFFFSEIAFGQDSTMVVSSYFNAADPRDEWSELLVVQDNLDIRDWSYGDNNSTQTSWQTRINFNNIDFWRYLRAGTVIIIWHRPVNSSGIPHPEEFDPSDGYLQICANNTAYFNGGDFGSAPTWNGNSLNIANAGDLLQIRDDSPTHVHVLGHFNTATQSATFAGLPLPKLNLSSATLTSNEVVMACPLSNIAPFIKLYGYRPPQNGNFYSDRSTVNITMGLPNIRPATNTSNTNITLWRSLRQPAWPTINPSFSIDANNTTVTLSWTPVPDLVSSDITTGYLILRNTVDVFSEPEDGTFYNFGDVLGGATVVSLVTPSTNSFYFDNISVPCTDGLYYRIYAYRYGIDNLNGNTYNVARGRAYNETEFASLHVTVIPITDPTFAAADVTEYCAGSPPANITLTADGAGETLEWFTGSCGGTWVGNGTPLTIAAPTSTTTYYARWNSSNSCLSTCEEVTVTVNPVNNASVVIAAIPPGAVCAGTPVTITATPTNSGTPGYQWYLNGNPVGADQPTYTFTPVASDQVYVEMTSVELCSDLATSNVLTMTVNAVPGLSAIGNSPALCGQNGSIVFNFTDVPDGIYDIDYATGTFTGVVVTSGLASVNTPAGFYENLNISVSGCTSTDDVDITLNAGAQPTMAAAGTNPVDCLSNGLIDFFFTNVPDGVYNIDYATGTFSGVVVTSGQASVPAPTGFYENLNITVTGCTTAEDVDITLSTPAQPTLAAVGNNPVDCISDGSIDFFFTNVPDGNYTITYATGIFPGVVVASGLASVSAPTGFYENLSITVTGCISTENVDITLNAPNQPTLAATGNNPVDCINNGSIDFFFSNITDGTYDIQYATGTFTAVVVTSGFANVSTPAGFYENLNITVTGCTSTEDVDITLTAPSQPALTAVGSDPVDCISNGSIDFNFTNVPDGVYDIDYATGSFAGVVVNSGFANVSAPAGFYENLNITVTGCTSAEDVDITLTAPAIPTLAATGNNPVDCINDGSIDFFFSNITDGTYDIQYATGSFTGVVVTSGFANVSTLAGFYENLSISVSGCTSTEDVDITLTAPGQPTLTAAGNNPVDCISNGSIDFDFTNVPDGTYDVVYSTGTFPGLVVISGVASVPAPAGFYENLSITVTGCTSAGAVDITLTAPGQPTLAAAGSNPVDCISNGSIDFDFTNIPDGIYDIVYVTGSFTGVVVTSGQANVSAPASFYENLSITALGCTSTEDVDITINSLIAPVIDSVTFPNPFCSNSNGAINIYASGSTSVLDYSFDNGNSWQASPDFVISSGGSYEVVVRDGSLCETTWPSVIEINLITGPEATVTLSSNAASVCQGEEVVFTAEPVNEGLTPVYRWLVNGVVESGSGNVFSYTPTNGDQVTVEVTSSEVCATNNPAIEVETVELSPCGFVMRMPNAFTPDNNTLNDVFKPVLGDILPTKYLLQVFDRWGGIVFETNNPDQGWDGTYKGSPANGGIYIYKLEFEIPEYISSNLDNPQRGTIILLR